ncbi:MAG: hypothetical protein PHX20_04370 [Candidatus Omnitrophica bacterium]|nr:hypothetical protein [Candidatus Omnitrophota bacterium]
MGLRTQRQMKLKQAIKRKAKRKRLTAKGENLNDFYYGKYYLKLGA